MRNELTIRLIEFMYVELVRKGSECVATMRSRVDAGEGQCWSFDPLPAIRSCGA
jgi:hypothetical protein